MVTATTKLKHLLLGRKDLTNLDSILESRDINLPTKFHLVKDMVFPVVTYGCESWTIKKALHSRIDAFELQCWKRLLRTPWTARRSNFSKGNQSWIFIGRTDAEAETAMHRPPYVKNWLIWKDPDARKDWRWEEKGTTEMVGWHHRLNGHEFEQALDREACPDGQGWTAWWWTGKPGVLQSMGSQRAGHDWATELNEHSKSVK